jgi:hypothetical protein
MRATLGDMAYARAIADYNETAEPFVWTKSEVHQKRVKGRPSVNCDSGY